MRHALDVQIPTEFVFALSLAHPQQHHWLTTLEQWRWGRGRGLACSGRWVVASPKFICKSSYYHQFNSDTKMSANSRPSFTDTPPECGRVCFEECIKRTWTTSSHSILQPHLYTLSTSPNYLTALRLHQVQWASVVILIWDDIVEHPHLTMAGQGVREVPSGRTTMVESAAECASCCQLPDYSWCHQHEV
jgi:hypothetical protein